MQEFLHSMQDSLHSMQHCCTACRAAGRLYSVLRVVMLLSCCRVQLSLTLHIADRAHSTLDLLFLHILSCKFVSPCVALIPQHQHTLVQSTLTQYRHVLYIGVQQLVSSCWLFPLGALPLSTKSHLLGGKVSAYSRGTLLASLLVLVICLSKPGLPVGVLYCGVHSWSIAAFSQCVSSIVKTHTTSASTTRSPTHFVSLAPSHYSSWSSISQLNF
jgi:hypothetical protein